MMLSSTKACVLVLVLAMSAFALRNDQESVQKLTAQEEEEHADANKEMPRAAAAKSHSDLVTGVTALVEELQAYKSAVAHEEALQGKYKDCEGEPRTQEEIMGNPGGRPE